MPSDTTFTITLEIMRSKFNPNQQISIATIKGLVMAILNRAYPKLKLGPPNNNIAIDLNTRPGYVMIKCPIPDDSELTAYELKKAVNEYTR